MHTESPSLAYQEARPLDPWIFLSGGSVGIVIGFGVDLLRLGVHHARHALAARSSGRRGATRGWHCSDTCDAGAR